MKAVLSGQIQATRGYWEYSLQMHSALHVYDSFHSSASARRTDLSPVSMERRLSSSVYLPSLSAACRLDNQALTWAETAWMA